MKIKWQTILHKTKASLLFQWFVCVGHGKKYFQKSLGVNAGQENQKIEFGDISIDINEWVRLEKVFTKTITGNEEYLKRYVENCYIYSHRLIALSKRTGKIADWDKLDNKEILKLYTSYQGAVLQLIPFLNSILILDGVLKKKISKLISSDLGINDEKEQNVFLSKSSTPFSTHSF